MNKVLSAIFLLFFLSSNAQQADGLGSLSGIVKNEANGEPIDFAAVSVFRQGSETIVNSFMTDNKGSFQFNNVAYGVYKIKVSFIGYRNGIIENIAINKDNPSYQLKDIKLVPDSNLLEAVVITEKKPLIEFGADTITFNVDQSMMAEGSTASDVLKNVPMVDVDIDGKPTIAGKINTRIFLDGKPSDYTAETITDLLNILPSDAIQKIEVLTNPDVRYSADGDGIINIVLKKGYKIGLNGAISLTGNTTGAYNTSLYSAYSDDKFSLNNTYGYKSAKSRSDVASLRTNYKNENIYDYINQYSIGNTNSNGHNFRTSMNWDITPKQNLRFSANYNNSGSGGDWGMDDYRLDANEKTTQTIKQLTDNGYKAENLAINADYTFKISKKNEDLVVGFNYFTNSSFRDRSLSRLILTHKSNVTTENRQTNENDVANSRLEFNADYRKPLTRLSSLSAGTKLTINDNMDNQSAWKYNFSSGIDDIIPQLTSDFDYKEMMLAFYGSYRLRTKTRWSFSAGVRSELTRLTIKQESPEGDILNNYINFFPNLSINKLYKKKYNFGLSYSMRIARPRAYALNPIINDLNQTNIYFGNPYLTPSYTNQFQFSFGTYGLKWSFTPRIAYSINSKVIERFRISSDSVTYANLGSIKALTFSLFGNYRPTKKITLSGSYTLSRKAYESASTLQPSRTGNSHNAKFSASAQLPYKMAFESSVNYFSNALAQGRTSGSVTTSFGVRKTLLKNKLLMRFMATDPFEDRNSMEYIDVIMPETSKYTNYKIDLNRILNTRNYSVTLSYRFTNTKKKEKLDSAIKEINKGPAKKSNKASSKTLKK